MLTWLEISKQAIEHNIKQFRKLVGANVLLMPVIKSNAYGHGFFEIAKICNKNKEVDRICVVCDDEANQLFSLKENLKKPVLILSFYELNENKILKLAKNNVIFPLYNEKQLNFLNQVGEMLGKKIKVHLKIDIGTSRIGVLPKNILNFTSKIYKNKFIEVEGIFGHFASIEENGGAYTKIQLKLFNDIVQKIESTGIKIKYKHTTCSAAMILFKNSYFNTVRFGLSLYGLHPSSKTIKKINLQPALSWFTTIIHLKTVPKGTKVGYGCTYTTKKQTKIATLPIGYWDGYDRGFSNNAHVIINGLKCPIIGRISMNLTTVDVSSVNNIEIGDRVILIGQSKKNQITADELAKNINTINYEITTRINPLLPRLVI